MTWSLTLAGDAHELQADSLRITYHANDRTTCDFDVAAIDPLYRPPLDAEVIITKDGVRLFGGLINRPTERGLGGGARPYLLTQCSAVDWAAYTDRRVIPNGGFPAGTTLLQALEALVVWLEPYGITLEYAFAGTEVQFLINQAEFSRYLSEGDPRLRTFFYAPTLTAYDAEQATLKPIFTAIITGMDAAERDGLYAGHATALGWARGQGFTGSNVRFLIQQAEFYRYVAEGDPRLQTFLTGTTLTNYAAEMATHDAGLDAVLTGMAVDESAAFAAGKAIAVADYGFSGTDRQFLVQQAEFYRWMPDGDPRILTFFYAPTLAAYEAEMGGAAETSMEAAVITPMTPEELAALSAGYAAAKGPAPAHEFTGTVVQFFIQQAEYYRWLPEGDARLLTFLSGDTLTTYATAMSGATESAFQTIIDDMAVDEAAAFAAAYAAALLQQQATGPVLPEINYPFTTVHEALDGLVSLTAADGEPYVWSIDAYKVLRMVQPSTQPAPFDILTNAPPQVVGDITVEPSKDGYANRVYVVATPTTEDGRIETLPVGDGVTSTFALIYTPSVFRGYVTSDGIFETLNRVGDADNATWSYDVTTNSVTRNALHPDGTPAGPPGVGVISTIGFDGTFSGYAMAQDASVFTDPWEKAITVDNVDVPATLQDMANALLAESLLIPSTITYRTPVPGLQVGQSQTVTVPARNVDITGLITEIGLFDAGNRLWWDVTVLGGAQSNLNRGYRTTVRNWSGDTPAGTGVSVGSSGPSSSGPAPPDTSVQFNLRGAFGGKASFTFLKDQNSLIVGDGSAITVSNVESCQVFGKGCSIGLP